MTFFKSFPKVVPLAITLFGFAVSAEAQVSWRTMTPSCLPTAGKMQRIVEGRPTPACHCPPKKYCPTTLSEWNSAFNTPDNQSKLKMPHAQIPLCCDPPFQCTVQWASVTNSACTTFITSGPQASEFCNYYEPKGLTEMGGGKTPAKPPADVANELNTCLRSKCGPLRKKLVDTAPKGFTGSTSVNAKTMEEFAACELTCRTDAAKALGIDTKRIDRSFYEQATRATSRFNGTSMPPRGASYLSGSDRRTPTPIPPGQGLEEYLVCKDQSQADICFTAIVPVACPPDPPPPSRDCFAAGTRVQLATGEERSIESLKPGDRIRGQIEYNAVVEVVAIDWKNITLFSINNGLLELTSEHPIMTSAGWKAIDFGNQEAAYGLKDVGRLAIGDLLMTETGPVEITSITALEPRTDYKTYSLRLAGDGTFYANGVIVKDTKKVD